MLIKKKLRTEKKKRWEDIPTRGEENKRKEVVEERRERKKGTLVCFT
jgi:hypothetical protein